MSDALMWVPRGRSRKTKLRVLPLLPLLHSFSLTHTHTLSEQFRRAIYFQSACPVKQK